jgi:translation initiation factor IF-3
LIKGDTVIKIESNNKVKADSNKVRINSDIRGREFRIIGVDGEQLGIMSSREALDRAAELRLDLVEISPTANPPVCRIMDYGKFLFEQKKSKAEAKKKQKQVQVKEIKFRPGTDIGDYNVKLKNILRFLEEGDKVKVTLWFRGREVAHQELGLEMLKRIEVDTAECAEVEFRPKMEGRQMIMIIAPKRKK